MPKVWTLLLTTGLALLLAASATATVTTVTTPASGVVQLPNGSTTFTASGTSDLTAGVDHVNLYCYFADSTGAMLRQSVAGNVPVTSGGAFTTSSADALNAAGVPCVLLAVKAGDNPSDLTGLTGPRIRVITDTTNVVPSGGSQKVANYHDDYHGPRAFDDFSAAGSCGLSDMLPFAAEPANGLQQLADRRTFSCDGRFLTNVQPTAGSYRSPIQIDGHDAYLPTNADSLQPNGPWPALFYTPTYDAAGDTYTIDEHGTLSRCPANNTGADTTSGNCSALSVLDVSMHRTTTTRDHGDVVEQDDVWSSPTGPHTVDLYDSQGFVNNGHKQGYQFPGEAAPPTIHNTIQTIAFPQADSPATILYSADTTTADGLANPQASTVLYPPPVEARFLDTNDTNYFLHYQFTIPANGSFTIRKIYSSEVSSAAVSVLTSDAVDRVQGPSVAISQPADQSTVNAAGVTVSGTDSDNVGVTSVTVNGQPATLGSGTFTKDITLNEGANVVTVVASDAAGNTAAATASVEYVKPSDGGAGGSAGDGGGAGGASGGGGSDGGGGGGGGGPPVPPAIAADGTVSCPAGGAACTATATWTSLRAFAAAATKKHRVILARWRATIEPGHAARAKPKLTAAGKKLLRKRSVRALRRIGVRAGTGAPVTASAKVTLRRIRKKNRQ